MEPLSTTESAVLRRVLEAQPTTPAKIAFAWRMSAGPALGRATTIEWRDGVVRVRADGEAWKPVATPDESVPRATPNSRIETPCRIMRRHHT